MKYNIGWQRYRYIEILEFVKIKINSFLVCYFKQCYLQRMRLYSALIFDFHHNKWVIFKYFLISMVFFSNSNFFLYKWTCLLLYYSKVYLSPSLVPVRLLYAWHLYCLTFVTSDVCVSEVCNGTKYSKNVLMLEYEGQIVASKLTIKS